MYTSPEYIEVLLCWAYRYLQLFYFINEWILSSLYNDFLCLLLQFLPFSLFLSEMTAVTPTSFWFLPAWTIFFHPFSVGLCVTVKTSILHNMVLWDSSRLRTLHCWGGWLEGPPLGGSHRGWDMRCVWTSSFQAQAEGRLGFIFQIKPEGECGSSGHLFFQSPESLPVSHSMQCLNARSSGSSW